MPTLTPMRPGPAVPAQQPQEPPEPLDRLELVITHEDIRRGHRYQAGTCAAALALSRTGYERPVVFGEITVGASERRIGYQIPRELWYWIAAFDSGQPVHPERFVLERIQS